MCISNLRLRRRCKEEEGPLGAPSCLVWKPVPVPREERETPATVSIVGKRQILNSFDQFSLKCWLAGEEDFEVFLLAIYILD